MGQGQHSREPSKAAIERGHQRRALKAPRVFSVSDEHDNTVRAGNPEIPTQMEEFDERTRSSLIVCEWKPIIQGFTLQFDGSSVIGTLDLLQSPVDAIPVVVPIIHANTAGKHERLELNWFRGRGRHGLNGSESERRTWRRWRSAVGESADSADSGPLSGSS